MLETLETRLAPTTTVYMVNTTADTDQANVGTTIGTDASGNISLRSAIEAANYVNTHGTADPVVIQFDPTLTANGPVEIDLTDNNTADPGLTVNDLVVGSNINLDTTIMGPAYGAGLSPLIEVKASVAGNDVFETAFDSNTNAADLPMVLTLQNLEITGGTEGAVFTGADNADPSDHSVTNLTGDLITGNTDDTPDGGGAVTNIDGDLNVSGCTFTNNQATGVNDSGGFGGAIFFQVQQPSGVDSHGSLSVTDSTFSNNTAKEADAAAGGAISVYGPNNSGNTYAISGCTFSSNAASGTDATGGAIANIADGTLTVSNSRFLNDSANKGTGIGASSGSVTASDDWWGADGGPTATGADSVTSGVTASEWLDLEVQRRRSDDPHQLLDQPDRNRGHRDVRRPQHHRRRRHYSGRLDRDVLPRHRGQHQCQPHGCRDQQRHGRHDVLFRQHDRHGSPDRRPRQCQPVDHHQDHSAAFLDDDGTAVQQHHQLQPGVPVGQWHRGDGRAVPGQHGQREHLERRGPGDQRNFEFQHGHASAPG